MEMPPNVIKAVNKTHSNLVGKIYEVKLKHPLVNSKIPFKTEETIYPELGIIFSKINSIG